MIAMTVTVITIPELAAALIAERLVERAVIDHVEALLALVRPLPGPRPAASPEWLEANR